MTEDWMVTAIRAGTDAAVACEHGDCPYGDTTDPGSYLHISEHVRRAMWERMPPPISDPAIADDLGYSYDRALADVRQALGLDDEPEAGRTA